MKSAKFDKFDYGFFSLACAAVIAFIAIIGTAVFVAKNEARKRETLFNNGICATCNSPFRFYDAVGTKGNVCYLYRCENCGQIVEMWEYRVTP